MKPKWINFDELREQLVFADVLAHYKAELTPKGDKGQHVGICPLPTHREKKGKTFSANLERGIWQCFGCRESGNVLDFAVLMEGKDKRDGKAVREVAGELYERFVKRDVPAPSSGATSKPQAPQPDSETKVIVNQPLDFELKTLDTAHPWFAEQRFSKETIERFGLGFCSRGFLSGRIAVPLVDDAAELVGYAGLAIDEKSERACRYLFPAPREHEGVRHVFDRGKFVYNGFRVARAVKDLIVVRECHTVWHLFQGGFSNVVALMGNGCGEEQATMLPLLTADTARIWLLTDSSEESQACAESFLPQVASSRLCRWVKVGTEEEMVPEHPLLAALPKR